MVGVVVALAYSDYYCTLGIVLNFRFSFRLFSTSILLLLLLLHVPVVDLDLSPMSAAASLLCGRCATFN